MTCRVSWLWLVASTAACGGNITVFGSGGAAGEGGSAQGGGGAAPIECDDDADCSALDGPCQLGRCDGGLCLAEPAGEGMACDDGLFCTVADRCVAGACAGSELSCPPAGACQLSVCDDSVDACVIVPAGDDGPCDDGDPCTGDGVCAGGSCTPGSSLCGGLDDACNLGVCTSTGCVAQPKPDGTTCNDGNICSSFDACIMGQCVGSGGPLSYFSEDFADNAAGWTLGSEWQIGAAAASTGHVFGNPDPAVDHSPSNDNGVAGVVLGGNASTVATHGYYWLESPIFDATIDPGPVVLSFHRWLNSDWQPWMNNRVEVWTGAQWLVVWESRGQPVTDAAWTKVEHDLTAFKNPAMRIRFGFELAQLAGVFVTSGWNIDDVVVAVASCP